MNQIGPSSRTYFSQRLRLHYADWGNSDAPPLILLHGGSDHCRNWDWTAEALRHDWHVICPDLRGHGDSQWTNDGNYPALGYIYDLGQLIDQLELAPVTIVAHSFGGHISLLYAGLYPDKVRKLVAIEGVGNTPQAEAEFEKMGLAGRLREWIEVKRKFAGKETRRYPTFDAAFQRMVDENPHLSAEKVRHLSIHAVVQNEDGSYSWKFDPLIRNGWPNEFLKKDIEKLYGAITCPTQMIYGSDSWAVNPATDGRIDAFGGNVSVTEVANAGHWVHHDQFDEFMKIVRDFI